MAEEAADNSQEDVVPLDSLVQEESSATVAGAPVPAAVPEPEKSDEDSEAASRPGADDVDLTQLDDIFSSEDPDFAASMQEMKTEVLAKEEGAEDIETLDLDSYVSETAAEVRASRTWRGRVLVRFKRFFRWLKVIGIRTGLQVSRIILWTRETAVPGVKTGVKKTLGFVRSQGLALSHSMLSMVKALLALPLSSKALLVAVVVLAGALIYVLNLTFKDQVMPKVDNQFLTSFSQVADARFTYDPKSPMEEFHNPLLHPENVILIERLIVNLKSPERGQNPMGLFEFYIEASNRETAIEVKDRESEVRDIMSRTLEQMPYDELISPDGKNKLKVVLRKSLNSLVTKGRVRRVFFKTIVLKP